MQLKVRVRVRCPLSVDCELRSVAWTVIVFALNASVFYLWPATSPWETDDFYPHLYTTRGTYTITVTATNALGNTTQEYVIVAQNPVTDDFVFSVDGPHDYTNSPGECRLFARLH